MPNRKVSYAEQCWYILRFKLKEVLAMPRKPKHPCGYPGCKELTEKRYCPEHEQLTNKQYEKYGRDPATRRRYGRAWHRIRTSYAQQHPYCEQCFKEGRMVVMEQVHHIKPLAIAIENHPTDGRVKIEEDGKVQTLTSRMETGGNNVPLLLKIRAGCEGGGKGPLIQTDRSATLSCNNDQTLFQPAESLDCRNIAVNPELSGTLQAKNNGGFSLNYINPVVYGICSKDSNSMKSDNPNSGFYEAKTTRTLDANGGNPSCNQGGMAVIEGNGSRPSHRGDGYKESEVMYTLNATEQHGVAYGIDRAAFNQGQNAKFGFAVEEEVEPTMVAKGPGAVAAPTYSASKASFFTEAAEEMAYTLVASDYKDPPLINDKPDDRQLRR